MKNILSVVFATMLLSIQLSAQTGTLRGTVVDDRGLPLPGAAVVLQGTTTGVSTDFDGKYSLDLPVGTHVIDFSFVSFAKKSISDVGIKEGEVTILDVSMESDAIEIKGATVTAKRATNTQNAMISMQRQSTKTLDGMGSQQMREIGDGNAAGAIRRIPGVSVQGGKHVYVRGLGDRYTKTILNGLSIPGLDPDRNSVQMDIFPTATIDNIIVYKTFSPDLEGDFTGGMVDVTTKDFPERKTFGIRYSAGFNPNMTFNENNISYDGGGLDLLGFDDGRRELPIAIGTQIPDPSQDDPRLTALTSSFDPGMSTKQAGNFLDQGFSVNAGNMKVGEKLTFGYNALINYTLDYNYYEDVEQGFYLREPDSEVFRLERESTRRGKLSQQDVLWSTLLTGAVKNNRSSLTLNLFRTQGGTLQAIDRVSTELDQNVATLVDDILMWTQRSLSNASLRYKTRWENEHTFEAKGSYSLSSLDDPDFRVSQLSVDGLDTLFREGDGAKMERYWRDLDEKNLSSRLDYAIPLEYENGEKGELKFGVATTRKERDFKLIRYNFRLQRDSTFVGDLGEPSFYFEEDNLWNIDSEVGLHLSRSGLEPSNTYSSTQSVYGAYVLNDYSFSKRFKVIYGLRTEMTQMYYTGINQDGDQRFTNSLTLDEINFLPSMSSIYKMGENSNLRFSLNRTLARPSFREKSVAQIFDPISKITFLGNIDLEQTDIDNIDLRWEMFPDLGEIFSVSGFYKRFDGHIEMAVFETAVENVKPVNSGISQVFGGEIELRKALNFLSDTSRVFSLGANVSIVRSRMDMSTVVLPDFTESELEIRRQSARAGETIEQFRTMAGQSPYLINAYLSMENRENGVSGNLSYNVQGRTLSIVGLGLVPDVYTQPQHLLNMRLAKKIGEKKRSTLSLRVNNLLDQDRILNYESFQAPNQIYSRFSDGMDFIFGYSYSIK